MPLQPDSLLNGRYRIHSELARGGMGAVYHGHDENLGIEVAIKENLIVGLEFERQFRREASLLAGLRHAHLPRVTDHFVISGQGQYLVMDFVAGEDVRQRLERQGGPLAEADVVRWARELLDALSYLHTRTQPIIHRDIKPGNIKITPDGRAVLVDFGLAKVYEAGSATTTVGAKALTPGFAPPEQYGTARTDSRTDLYSLAATLYAMLTNRVPADGFERAVGQTTLVPIRQLNPSVAQHVAAAIEKALGVRPDERFNTASEFSAALITPLAGAVDVPTATIARPNAPTPTVPTRPAPEPVTQPTRPMRWALPVFAVVILVLGAGGVGLWATGMLDPLLRQVGFVAQPTATATQAIVIADVPTGTPSPLPPTASPTFTEEPQATSTLAPSETPAPTDTLPPTVIPFTETPSPTPMGGGQGQIAFASNRNGLPQIFIMDIDGNNQVQITDIADGACQPAWSPDGARLVFVSPCTRKQDLYNNAAIYIVNVPAKPDGLLSASPFITRVGGNFDPDWSEAGVAFTFTGGDRAQIYVADANGQNAQVLSEPRSADTQPSWAQGGAKLAFRNGTRSGRSTIYWMNQDGSFDGSIPTQITRELSPCNNEASSPAWAPDGAFVAYVVNQHICVVAWDAKGFNPKQITNKSPNADPAWSPDSQWLVFESWRDAAKHEIYVMNAAGGAVTRLTNNDADEFQPAWRP